MPGRRPKSITTVRRVIADHAGALEADLARYYGVDLADLYRDGSTLTYRRVHTLLERLPAESELVLELYGERARWDDRTELAALAVDLLNRLTWQHARLHFRGVDSKPPDQIERPRVKRGSARQRRRHMTIEEMRQQFG